MRVRIVSWNVWGANVPGTYWRDRVVVRGARPGSVAQYAMDEAAVWSRREAMITKELASLQADVVLLQEAVHRVGPVGHRSGQLAVMSPHPLRPLDLPGACAAEVAGITVANVHLPLAGHEPLIDDLIVHIASLSGPVVIAGDFNLPPDHPLIQRLLDAGWVDATAAVGPTMPSHDPEVRLDYIFVVGRVMTYTADRLGADSDADGFLPSDHLGLTVELTWTE